MPIAALIFYVVMNFQMLLLSWQLLNMTPIIWMSLGTLCGIAFVHLYNQLLLKLKPEEDWRYLNK